MKIVFAVILTTASLISTASFAEDGSMRSLEAVQDFRLAQQALSDARNDAAAASQIVESDQDRKTSAVKNEG
jgi:hypothetical protein